MNQIFVDCQTPPYSIPLGRKGENLAVQIVFDCTEFVRLYGDGTAQLMHKQAQTNLIYPVDIEQNGSTVKWTVTNADTAESGIGQAEFRWYSGKTLAKSVVYRTSVSAIMEGTESETAPLPQQSWVDSVLQAAEECKNITVTPESLEEAVAGYLEDHPIESGMSEDAVKAYVNEAIQGENKSWELINTVTLDEDSNSVIIDLDSDGAAFDVDAFAFYIDVVSSELQTASSTVYIGTAKSGYIGQIQNISADSSRLWGCYEFLTERMLRTVGGTTASGTPTISISYAGSHPLSAQMMRIYGYYLGAGSVIYLYGRRKA